MKKVISMNYGSSKRSWKPWRWMRLDLIFSMGDIYINSNPNLLTKSTSIHQHKNSHKPCDEMDASFWIWWKVNGNWDNNIFSISQWRESHCRTNTNSKKEISPKEQDYENHSLGKVIWDRKIVTEFASSISSTRIGKPVLMMDVKVSRVSSKSQNFSRYGKKNFACYFW